jgi:hypothetical protein
VVVEKGGGCSPLQKAKHALDAGAFAAVLDADEMRFFYEDDAADPPLTLIEVLGFATPPFLFLAASL